MIGSAYSTTSIERRGAGLGHRAQRLFQDGGQAAGLVAGRGIVVHLRAVDRRCSAPTSRGARAAWPATAGDAARAIEQVLGAVDLRRLGEDHRAAEPDQPVGGDAQRRVGGDARPGVRAAALQAEHDLAGRHLGAPRRIRPAAAVACSASSPSSIARRVPPVSWMVKDWKSRIRAEAVVALQPADLHHLAAEADQQHAAEVRVGRRAPERAAQHVEPLAGAGHAAAAGVGDRHDAVDVRIVVQQAAASRPPRRCGARPSPNSSRRSARRYSCARPPPVRAAIAHESCAAPRCAASSPAPRRRRAGRTSPGCGCGRARRRRSARGDADHLAVFAHRLSPARSARWRSCGRWNGLARGHVAGEHRARRQPANRHDHVVGRMQPDRCASAR